MSVISAWGSSIISPQPHAWQRWQEKGKEKKNMLIWMTHLNHTPPTLYLIHFLIRATEWGRTADLRWWSQAVKKRGWEGEWERSGVQSLPTAWLHISLQHGTYLSSVSHAHEHLTLWFVKEKKNSRKLKPNQCWPTKEAVYSPYLIRPPIHLHSPCIVLLQTIILLPGANTSWR